MARRTTNSSGGTPWRASCGVVRAEGRVTNTAVLIGFYCAHRFQCSHKMHCSTYPMHSTKLLKVGRCSSDLAELVVGWRRCAVDAHLGRCGMAWRSSADPRGTRSLGCQYLLEPQHPQTTTSSSHNIHQQSTHKSTFTIRQYGFIGFIASVSWPMGRLTAWVIVAVQRHPLFRGLRLAHVPVFITCALIERLVSFMAWTGEEVYPTFTHSF